MKVLPFKHVYDSPVGRRIYFIYGDVFDHSRIDEATMNESVPSFFGNGNMTFFEHISLMIRKGHAVDAQGRDVYLSNTDRYRMPISFMTGEHNRMFVPRGLEETHELLREANGPDLYSRHVIQDYAHLDCWLGDERRARRVPDRPRRAGAPQLHDRAGRRPHSTRACRTSSPTRWPPASRTGAPAGWRRACRCRPARCPTRARTTRRR